MLRPHEEQADLSERKSTTNILPRRKKNKTRTVSGPILVPILDPKVVPELAPLPIYVVRNGSKNGTTFGPKFGTTFGPLYGFAPVFLGFCFLFFAGPCVCVLWRLVCCACSDAAEVLSWGLCA